jgi:hypothetical protein
MYEVIGSPPSVPDAVQLTESDALPGTRSGVPGALGTVGSGVPDIEFDEPEFPAALLATTVTEYVVPLPRPLMVQLVAVVTHDDPFEAVAVYEVMGDPPSPAGACHEASKVPLPGVTPMSSGGPLTVYGVTAIDEEGGEVPAEFVAVTLTEYGWPFVRPPIVQLVPPVEHDAPPGWAVAAYEVMTAPPSDEGGDHDNAADSLPGVTEVMLGADGATGTSALHNGARV